MVGSHDGLQLQALSVHDLLQAFCELHWPVARHLKSSHRGLCRPLRRQMAHTIADCACMWGPLRLEGCTCSLACGLPVSLRSGRAHHSRMQLLPGRPTARVCSCWLRLLRQCRECFQRHVLTQTHVLRVTTGWHALPEDVVTGDGSARSCCDPDLLYAVLRCSTLLWLEA